MRRCIMVMIKRGKLGITRRENLILHFLYLFSIFISFIFQCNIPTCTDSDDSLPSEPTFRTFNYVTVMTDAIDQRSKHTSEDQTCQIYQAHRYHCAFLGIVTGCRTRVPVAAGYSRVRVRVGFIQPRPYPYPQPGVGGSAHIFKLRQKSTQTMPDASFGPYVGMFSSFFSRFFPN